MFFSSPDYQRAILKDFHGEGTRLDPQDQEHAAEARNCEFDIGKVSTRRGFADYTLTSHTIRRLFYWTQTEWDRLLFFKPGAANDGKVVSRDQFDNSEDEIITGLSTNIVGASFAEFGARVFMAFLNATGMGEIAGKVWNGLFQSPPGEWQVDDLFQDKLLEGTDFTTALAEPASGDITPGVHKLAVSFITRQGHETPPELLDAAVFTAAGAKNLQVTLTPTTTWPGWVREYRFLMTTVQNQERYRYVASSTGNIAFGTAVPVIITVDISDEALGLGEDATDQFDIYTGNAKIKMVLPYGDRMVYLTELPDENLLQDVSTLLISDRNLPQTLSLARNQIRLPGAQRVNSAFRLQRVLYLLGDAWTYATVDNGQFPVNWQAMQLIDGRRGTLSVHGVAVNNAHGIAWVADRSGLYVFNGSSYPARPISYHQAALWERINWAALPSGALQVFDCPVDTSVIVLAPLDAETIPTRAFVWDYKFGFSPDKVRFSTWTISGYDFGAMEVAQNFATRAFELIVANGSSDKVLLRRVSAGAGDANLYRDGSAGIDSLYRTKPVVPPSGAPYRLRAARARLKGSGTINWKVHDYDEVNSKTLAPVTAAAAPGQKIQRKFLMNSETCRHEFDNGAVADAFFELAELELAYLHWIGER